ncbi:efflux RND transporter permease subunit [Congregibacter brevis]|uniref:Efflux RND transporter permease subunit n=1 Tax=Congregibacter brevis TaxID=3081201 RepID=A0ABZ0IJ66_9GAMM|nr:efflux RND transporter permease subunit [Congregibacter sp. IMCC45268]
MNLAEFSIRNRVLSFIVIALAIAGGWSAYQDMPRFEDPEFTIRTAMIITQYPGATPLEVAQEVTEPLERALQQLAEVDDIESTSVPGRSEIMVNIKYAFSPTKAELQLIWTKVRNKVADAALSLPPGVGAPYVNDDFGDVYGLYYFLTGPGFTPAELRRYAKSLQSDLLQVDGVAKVQVDGALNEAIFVEISQSDVASLGVAPGSIYQTLENQNTVVSAGELDIGTQRLAVRPSGAIDSVEAIRNLLIDTSSDGRLIYLSDVAHVWRGYQTPPAKLYRFNGEPAVAIGVSGILGGNIVQIGAAVEDRLQDIAKRRPVGMQLHQFYNQAEEVDAAVSNFVVNVIAALAIVIGTLLIFMGFKSAIVIGSVLLLTIAATLATMQFMDIPMHRISLGALIIALGMMVDNAIVVTEGILVGVQRGAAKLEIAKQIVSQTQWPLLGGTLVGIIAFAPIGFAPGDTAEYTGHLFWVILISLLYSWLFAVTLTPFFCDLLFREASGDSTGQSADSGFTQAYKSLLSRALSARKTVVLVVVAMFVASVWGFQFVKAGFFPQSTSPQMVVDYWLPQGTRIEQTQSDADAIEEFVRGLEGVVAVETSIGAGGLRYMLVYGPESNNSAYAQLLVRTGSYQQIDDLITRVQSHIDARYPDAQGKVWRFVLGPGGGSKIEARFSGPEPDVLRRLADQAKAIMVADGGAISIKDNWRQQLPSVRPLYSEAKGRRAGVSRTDLASAIASNFSGATVGVYREGDDLLPIIARAPLDERKSVADIENVQVLSSATGESVPISQVVDGFKTTWDNGALKRLDRIWTIKAQSDPVPGQLASDLLERIQDDIESIELPPGYSLTWDGEYGNSKESNENLASTIPFGFLAMVLVVVVLFGTVRQPVAIWLAVPLALIGVVIGLLVTGIPMEFMAILGLLSLSGLLIKNAIVLIDQIDMEIATGLPRFTAVVAASASRVRPVMMGTLTTVLGVIPLFYDAFFQSMAVVIVFGLTFATVLTLFIVPVIYCLLFGIGEGEVSHES